MNPFPPDYRPDPQKPPERLHQPEAIDLSTPHQRALQALDALRDAMTAEDVSMSLQHLDTLKSQVRRWQQSVGIRTARTYLDSALQGDLLAFDTNETRNQLGVWAALVDDDTDPELARYRGAVEERTRRKQSAFQVRGITSHCDSLLLQADQLERSTTTPHPDFVMSQYYQPAQAIVSAARREHPDHADLDVLAQRVDRVMRGKTSANSIYVKVLTDEAYSEALRLLSELPGDLLIPRFTHGRDTDQPVVFDTMLPIDEAREQLQAMAVDWALRGAETIITFAQTYLDAHNPGEAVSALESRTQYEPFLKRDVRTRLDHVVAQAQDERDRYNRAGERARQGMQLVENSPVEAWDTYVEAYNLYQWHPTVRAAREAAVNGLQGQLSQIIGRAEAAFDDRQMAQVRQIVSNGTRIYSNKAPELDTLLERLRELDEMTDRYEEYLQAATETYQQVRSSLDTDSVGANDLLTQLESYPDLVLQSFPDLGELRITVNQRLNADQTYSQLYTALFSDDREVVLEQATIAQQAAEDFDDPRFNRLVTHLRLHGQWLAAQSQASAGQIAQAIVLLDDVIAVTDHPDYARAIQLSAQLRREDNEATT